MAVRLADKPAALNYDLSLAALNAGMANSCHAPSCGQWKLRLFFPPGKYILIRKHSTLQVAAW